MVMPESLMAFLSSNAQDFIEDGFDLHEIAAGYVFLSSNAQDFIEEGRA